MVSGGVFRWELEAYSARAVVKEAVGTHAIPMKQARAILDRGFSTVRIYEVSDGIRRLARVVSKAPGRRRRPWWHQVGA